MTDFPQPLNPYVILYWPSCNYGQACPSGYFAAGPAGSATAYQCQGVDLPTAGNSCHFILYQGASCSSLAFSRASNQPSFDTAQVLTTSAPSPYSAQAANWILQTNCAQFSAATGMSSTADYHPGVDNVNLSVFSLVGGVAFCAFAFWGLLRCWRLLRQSVFSRRRLAR